MLGAAYGRLPQEIAALPWVKVKMIADSYMKRQAREWKMQTALAGVQMARGMGGMLGAGAAGPVNERGLTGEPATPVAALVGMGLPVNVRK
ncbi:MAG TPA: hypothetical protein VFJ52_05950, partial [Terriglobia bacterium]|nr:hypothetical protein [Terriglobia bacterium]